MLVNHPERLKNNPRVKSANMYSIELKENYLIEIFDAWKKGGETGVIKDLNENGIQVEDVGSYFIRGLIARFKACGYPIDRDTLDYAEKERHPLILSGKYQWSARRRGLEINPMFRERLFLRYPGEMIEDEMIREGIDPRDVGINRIRRMEKEFEEEKRRQTEQEKQSEAQDEEKKGVFAARNSKNIPIIMEHPYVKAVDATKIQLKESFYREAHLLLPLGIERILQVFEFDVKWFNRPEITMIGAQLTSANPTQDSKNSIVETEQTLRIWKNREEAMMQVIAKGFQRIKEKLPYTGIDQRRAICKWVDTLPRDPWKYYTTQKILEEIGIPRSTYYELLSNESYGKGTENRARREEEDFLLIQQVADYKGFAKGYRQISMMTEPIAGQYISPNRVLNLMRKYGMRTTIRRASKNRKAMKELLGRNGKPNLLLRQFKLHRPNEVRLTDVTYLNYGNSLRAYGSASIDPVTGRLICFVVSENNDLQLALDTLAAMDQYPAVNGGLIHSDQGILYFTDDFQAAVRDRNLIQSMSRRGNCWDNAPQESFFGHFKDESGYKKCRNLEELRRKVEEYGVYYNEERRIWSRGKMTPLEYEEYLTNMDEESFAAYLAKEEETHQKKKEQSTRKAVEKAKKQLTGRGE